MTDLKFAITAGPTIGVRVVEGQKGDDGGPIPAGGTVGDYPTPLAAGGYGWQSKPHVDIRDYGAVGNGTTDNKTAIQAAINAASVAGGSVLVPKGTFKVVGDLTVVDDNVSLVGTGLGSKIALVGGALMLDGRVGHLFRTIISDLTISRTGTVGPALDLVGGGTGSGVVRWGLHNVWISGSTGTGLRIAGSYIGTITNVVIQACALGVEISADAVLGNVFGNAVSWHGGEIQGCAKAFNIDSAKGIQFFGVAIEGNTLGGETHGTSVGLGWFGCYFEANGTYDLKIGTTGLSGTAFLIEGCHFAAGPTVPAKTNSIILHRGVAINITGNNWSAYGGKPVRVEELSAGAVRGIASNNWGGGIPNVVDLNGATRFGESLIYRRMTFEMPVSGTVASEYRVLGDVNSRLNIVPGGFGGVLQAGDGVNAPDSVFRRGNGGNRWVCENALEIDGALDHDGTTVGFYGATPVVKAAAPGTATGTDAAVVNAVVTALRNLGLVT